jgi:hypothetical protein
MQGNDCVFATVSASIQDIHVFPGQFRGDSEQSIQDIHVFLARISCFLYFCPLEHGCPVLEMLEHGCPVLDDQSVDLSDSGLTRSLQNSKEATQNFAEPPAANNLSCTPFQLYAVPKVTV